MRIAEATTKAKERVLAELKRFVVIALYLWVLLSLFEIHRYIVLRSVMPTSISGYRIGFAALNAIILGKVIVIGEAARVGERFKVKRLVYAVLLKAAIFSLLLVCFDIVEEVITGLIKGKSVVASLPHWGGGGVEGFALVAVMAFVVLIPLFLFTAVQRVIGKETLRSLIFESRSTAKAA